MRRVSVDTGRRRPSIAWHGPLWAHKLTALKPLAERPALSGQTLRLLLSGAVLVYTAGFVLWYSATPLGLYPVLDGREMVALAHAIAEGTLPREPFYRAPVYPAVLAGLLEAGWPARELPFAARLLNGALHLLASALVWRLARALWARESPALLAAVLYGLNPVALHFAGDPLDVTLAIALLLGGLLATVSAGARHAAPALAAAGALLALAALTRPQLMAVLLAWCAWLGWSTLRRPVRARAFAAGITPVAALLAAMGLVNLALGGEFRVLPWQGSFDLHAANRPGADGRYFVQRTRAASFDAAANPARLEAEQGFRAAHPQAAATPAAVAGYWRDALVRDVAAAPGAWLSLLARKAFYLLNDVEQYNNKTYAFHKARSPWLRHNPLGWAVVLALAAAGCVAGRRDPRVRLLLGLAAAYAAALVVSYVSARFRLPLVALLAVLAGGALPALSAPRERGRAALAAVLAAAVALVPIPRADRERTFVQDRLLLARANAEHGLHAAARRHAGAALVLAPGHPAALELVCVAGFNAWLAGTAPEPPAADCERAAPGSPPARRIAALAAWRRSEHAHATAELESLLAPGSPERDAALAALVALGLRSADDPAATARAPQGTATVLLLARALRGDTAAREELERRLAPAAIAREIAALRRALGTAGSAAR